MPTFAVYRATDRTANVRRLVALIDASNEAMAVQAARQLEISQHATNGPVGFYDAAPWTAKDPPPGEVRITAAQRAAQAPRGGSRRR